MLGYTQQQNYRLLLSYFFTLSHIFASWKIIINRYCFHHEDKNQLRIHLTAHDLSFLAVNCHSFCGHSTKPLHARTLKSIRQRQEIHGIFKDFRMISFVWWWEQKDQYKSRTRFYNSNSFVCFWFQQRIYFSPKIITKYMFYFQYNLWHAHAYGHVNINIYWRGRQLSWVQERPSPPLAPSLTWHQTGSDTEVLQAAAFLHTKYRNKV